jgi:pimeloyl-ACP methyl ester carboxylesterase
VIRGAASDVMSAEVADRMVDDVIPYEKLETIARAGHSVMLDNPEAFEKALCAFILGE